MDAVLNADGDQALEAACRMALSGKWSQPPQRPALAALPSAGFAENMYASMPYPPIEYRLPAAARIWGAFPAQLAIRGSSAGHYKSPVPGGGGSWAISGTAPRLVAGARQADYTVTMASHATRRQAAPCVWLYDLDELLRTSAGLEGLRNAVGAVNPRLPGWHNHLIQLVKKALARLLAWYTRPLRDFNASVSRSLEQIVCALDHLSMNVLALDRLRVAQSENRSAGQAESIREQLELLHQRITALQQQKIPNPEDAAGAVVASWRERAHENSGICEETDFATDRTAYIMGLFGTGRLYLNELIRQNIGERARYFRDTIRLHPGPTPMIYSGHATIRHVSREQASPAVTSCILEAVRSRFADSIFIYRHPLDSLLTNWIWWRTYIRENIRIPGISAVYKNSDDLCADLDSKFFEFKAFAQGDPDFFATCPGPRFLSFPEFVEETELHVQAASLALRLEDFMVDPSREFCRIADVMSVDLDLNRLSLSLPKTRAYGYLAVKERVPRFERFIHGLDAATRRRIEKLGFDDGGLS